MIKKITEMKGENSTLEIQLDETSRFLKLAQNKEKHFTEGKTINIYGYKIEHSPKNWEKLIFAAIWRCNCRNVEVVQNVYM